jgi:polyhydroxybutyrate depolymerase
MVRRRTCLWVIGGLLLVCLALAAVALRTGYVWSQEATERLSVDGRDRYYRVHLPPGYDGSTPYPLVLVLHGGGGHATNVEKMSGMSELADREGFIAVYPNGTGLLRYRLLTWNAVDNCCGYAHEHDVNDVAFFRALIEQLQQDYNIDPNRIFVTGISNGGMMAYRLGCEMADTFAAIAPVAGAMNLEVCDPRQPVSVIVFHGMDDQHVLYEGGPSREGPMRGRIDTAVADSVAFWVTHNSCSSPPEHLESGSIITETYPDCAAGTSVAVVSIVDGGHAWPGGEAVRRVADEPTREISASETMWDFFKSHPKRHED